MKDVVKNVTDVEDKPIVESKAFRWLAGCEMVRVRLPTVGVIARDDGGNALLR